MWAPDTESSFIWVEVEPKPRAQIKLLVVT